MRLGGIELVPVRIKIPQVLKAEWIWEIVARDSGEEKESEAKRGVQSITGTWLIFSDGGEYGKWERTNSKSYLGP